MLQCGRLGLTFSVAHKKAPNQSGLFYMIHLRGLLALPAFQYQGGVGATEAEAVAHHGVDFDVFNGLGQDRHIGNDRVDLFDVGRRSPMPEPDDVHTPPPAGGPDAKRKLLARRRNEHLRLAASALDRLSTVVLGGAVLAPIIQHNPNGWWETAGWVSVATVLHIMAQYLLGLLREES